MALPASDIYEEHLWYSTFSKWFTYLLEDGGHILWSTAGGLELTAVSSYGTRSYRMDVG
jgi:hypothetical protein